ncbi:hypothetical protein RTH46_16985 [Pseudomonas sp. zfem004]|uniref:hypothetical protein n=1 Tax=unclassified Pseudomonas TaxID=196821 RepID=UPI00129BCAAE|nr:MULTISPECIES: hypothetical protein [unclassified Pseudomonas]MDU9404185.1 hypothetical protein [Pseudomonas sp. zfem004]
MFAAMVIAMTLMVSAFILAWWFSPELQRWSEAPKYTMLEREQRYSAAAKAAEHP